MDHASTRPAVIAHNSVSVDGAVTEFDPDLAHHYAAVADLEVDGHLIGSVTMAGGLDSEGGGLEDPGPELDRPPEGREGVSRWFVVDSTGRLHGRLHELRAFPGLRDIVVLVSDRTPRQYVEYLAERQYDHFRSGADHVDLAAALRWMGDTYGARRVLVDSGPILARALLERGLVDELSLMVHPIVAGTGGRRLFEGLAGDVALDLLGATSRPGGIVHLRHRVAGRE